MSASDMPHSFSGAENSHDLFLTDDADLVKSLNVSASLWVFFNLELRGWLRSIMQQISESLFVNLNHGHFDGVFHLQILVSDGVEDLTSCPWHYTHQVLIEDIVSIHCIGLPTTSLSISENSTIIAIHDVNDLLLSDFIKNDRLGYVLLEYVIEGKSHVISAMTTVIFSDLDSPLVFTEFKNI